MKNQINLTDQELVRAYINGNANALSSLVERYKDKIFTSIYLLVKDKYLAEDIFQEAFVKIINTLKLGAYNEEGKFLPWAMRISHNLVIDHFRKSSKVKMISESSSSNKSYEVNLNPDMNNVADLKRMSQILPSQDNFYHKGDQSLPGKSYHPSCH
jgi:RNA polymerase sigma-70 factor (ECF subfamily)